MKPACSVGFDKIAKGLDHAIVDRKVARFRFAAVLYLVDAVRFQPGNSSCYQQAREIKRLIDDSIPQRTAGGQSYFDVWRDTTAAIENPSGGSLYRWSGLRMWWGSRR